MKLKRYGIYILLALLLLTGCINKKPVVDEEAWKNEILWAQECGLEGMMCCADPDDKDLSCFYGLDCCVNPIDSKINYCAEDCTCGKEKNFCCAEDPKCEEGLACWRGFCTPCGDDKQPCCISENQCSSELICYNNTCLACGLPGNPCCQEGVACQNQDKKDNTRSECRNGLCNFCGFKNNIACQEEPKCNQGQ
ncbi:hypothetical protein ACFLZ9_02370, partial [Patescibacteria group bacterium]